MFARFTDSRVRRRGVVLVLILGMLALLAVVGVTFATFSGQARVSSRNFAQSQNVPESSELMDFALSQLIDDTSNTMSAIRGHSLKRDMFGNDGANNGYLASRPNNGAPLQIQTTPTLMTAGTHKTINGVVYDVSGLYMCLTNVVAQDSAFYGLNFTRWIASFGPGFTGGSPESYGGLPATKYLVAQTFEILLDDNSGTDPAAKIGSLYYRVFYFPALTQATAAAPITGYSSPLPPATAASQLSTSYLFGTEFGATGGIPIGFNMILDGRYLHAFNGPGMGANGVHGNFRLNGQLLGGTSNVGEPNNVGMDEDYDACDLENWFLAIQSADGQVVIPSFHRPGILRADPTDSTAYPRALVPSTTATNDWWNSSSDSAARFLRPRQADGHSPISFPDLLPDSSTGKITYDVDNDGDGNTDAVWLDLGYPTKRSSNGQLYKPLFAFTVIGLNGRLPLNTAGNLQQRDVDGNPLYLSASHLGNSPSEVDPTFALQAPHPNFGFQQFDNAGHASSGDAPVPVNATQLRNLLAGTKIPDWPTNPIDSTTAASWPPTTGLVNGDANLVPFGNITSAGQLYYILPNGVQDTSDYLTGSTVSRGTTSVEGRWGEGEGIPSVLLSQLNLGGQNYYVYNNFVRAGLSNNFNSMNSSSLTAFQLYGFGDIRDDNFTTYDPYPQYFTSLTPPTPPTTFPEYLDLYDPAGALTLPVERIRRFVVPADTTGDGQIITWKSTPYSTVPANATYSPTGGDQWGRVTYYKYNRPPGLPFLNFGTYAPPTAAGVSGTFTPGPAVPSGAPDLTSNPYHGYESYRDPKGGTTLTWAVPHVGMGIGTDTSKTLIGGAPHDNGNGRTAPTFTYQVNSALQVYDSSIPGFTPWVTWQTPGGLPMSSPSLDEADEMQLNASSQFDKPFGPNDLQWLYRQQDSDGRSLQSRLASLAPISFTNAIDGLRRRRLFALDSWETNKFIWAYDNPVLPMPNGTTVAAFPDNSNIQSSPTTGSVTLSYGGAYLEPSNSVTYTVPANTTDTFANYLSNASMQVYSMLQYNNHSMAIPAVVPAATPTLAHGDRKINLNFPLPVSTSPDEPIRHKWITDSYQLLKRVLPPMAVDTPEELAQLSQFLVNAIDFRDPDSVITRFVNPDLELSPAALGVTKAPMTLGLMPAAGLGVGAVPVEQFGMEYCPVAINEVLAYSFLYNGGSTKPANRFFVELVNTLTEAAGTSGTTNASSLDLQYWDMVITTDDPGNIPDPNTGQLVQTGAGVYTPIPLNQKSFNPPNNWDVILQPLSSATSGPPASIAGTATTLPSMYYYVIGSKLPIPNIESNEPSPTATTPSLTQTLLPTINPFDPSSSSPVPTPTNGAANYYWVHLRRPANPFKPPAAVTGGASTYPDPTPVIAPPTTTPDANYNPMVVVDSFRFPYIEGKGTGTSGSPDIVNPGTNALYSMQRLQPYRGGHSVPLAAYMPMPTSYDQAAYGYSEQTAPVSGGGASSTNTGLFAAGGMTPETITATITHTLGLANQPNERWSYFPFHDRDFSSVAELMLVPGCPPGLFTKNFVESAPTGTAAGSTFPISSRLSAPPPGATVVPLAPNAGVKLTTPHSYPYLVDNFFYSAASPVLLVGTSGPSWAGDAPNSVYGPNFLDVTGAIKNRPGGPSGAGWYRMFEFFEVPSPAAGSIGPVAQGFNYDWLRNDTKPGLLNLNLIIDEEVFLGLMGNAGWVSNNDATNMAVTGAMPPLTYTYNPNTPQNLNGNQMLNPSTATTPPVETGQAAPLFVPKVVTMIDPSGSPAQLVAANPPVTYGHVAAYPMPNVGFYANDPYPGSPLTPDSRMKAAFSDFLKLRHGGSGYLFAWGGGQVGNAPTGGGQGMIASERPFRSLSFPDINYTILRPAALPPSQVTLPLPNATQAFFASSMSTTGIFTPVSTATNPVLAPTNQPFVWDPGVKNPFIWNSIASPVLPPPNPPRRLFQIPDADTPGTGPFSNAGESADPYVVATLVNPNLYSSATTTNATPPDLTSSQGGSAIPAFLQRGLHHPQFRSEWLQKVMNLTTVRTHQYAVWITVGFFEVTSQGDPSVADTHPLSAVDILGLELGLLTGKNIRYRSFFLVDRSSATGFNPYSPGDFRSCIVYRQAIE